MDSEIVIALSAVATLAVLLIAQSSMIAYYFGKMATHIASLATVDAGIKEDIAGLADRIHDNDQGYYKTFESKNSVDLKIKAMRENLGIFTDQNSKEHNDILVNSEKINISLEKMNNCLHRLDKEISNGVKK